MSTELERAMRLMRSRDPQTAEDGFQTLSVIAADHVDEPNWAIRSVKALDTKDARRLLWVWEQNQPGAV